MKPTAPAVTKKALDALRGRMGGLALAGGTGLSVYYLAHRRSDDLDLFLPAGKSGGTTALDAEAARILEAWQSVGMTARHEFDHEADTGIIGRRYRLLDGLAALKADFILDPIPLLSTPEDFEGIRVMGIDDIYARKILIAASGIHSREPRLEPRDLLDLHALSAHHHRLEKRLIASKAELGALKAMNWWLDHFTPRAVKDSMKETGYEPGCDAVEIIEDVRESLRVALAKLLKKGFRP